MAQIEGEAAGRFLNAPMLADMDADSRRAVLDVLVEERAKAGSVVLPVR